MRIDQVIFELALGGVEYLDQIAKSKTGRSSVITRDIHFDQAGRLNVAAGDAQRLTDIPQGRSRGQTLIEADGVEADTSFVQQSWLERVGPVDDRVPDGLVTALDGAAVAEHAASEGWLVEIHLRPASENMVLLRGVVIDFQVALVVVQVISALIKEVVGPSRLLIAGKG